MKKRYVFNSQRGNHWPNASHFRIAFAAETLGSEYGGGYFSIDGLANTHHLPDANDRVNATIYVVTHPVHGVMIMHRLWDGRVRRSTTHFTRGDLTKRLQFWETVNGEKNSIGLFVPPEVAWPAIRDFIEQDGALSPSVPWINGVELPADTFPELPPPDPSKWKRND